MGPIYAFMFLSILIGGSALVADKANGAELPEVVEVIHTEEQVYVPSDEFKEFLRHPGVSTHTMPKTISWRITCYSDGSTRVSSAKGWTAADRALTPTGYDILRATVLDMAYHTCSMIWEARYEHDANREGERTWYL